MFERFTEDARRTLFYARHEASEFGHEWIGPEHMLLGLLTRCDELLRSLFARVQVSSDAIGASVAARMTSGRKFSTSIEIPFTEATKRVLQFAVAEADQLRHAHVGTEHLLVALLREAPSLAAEALAAHGLRLEAVRAGFAAIEADAASSPPPPPPSLPLLPGDEPG